MVLCHRENELVVAAGGSGGSLLNFGFGLCGFLVGSLQISVDSEVGLSLTSGIRFRTGRRTSGNAILSLIVSQFLKTFRHLRAEVVVHVLKIGDRDRKLRTRGAVVLLAAGHEHGNFLVGVRSIANARQDVTRTQRAFGSVGGGFGENSGNQESAQSGIESRGNFVGALLLTARRWSAADGSDRFRIGGSSLFRSDLSSDFVRNHLLHLRRKGGRGGGGGSLIVGSRSGISGGSGVGISVGNGAGFIGSLEIGGDHVVGNPESGRGVIGSRSEIGAVITIPRSSTPTPTIGDGRGPRIVGPAIISGTIVVGRNVTVITVAMIVVAAISVGIAAAAIVIAAAHISVAATIVAVLGIAAAMAVTDYAHAGTGMSDELAFAVSPMTDGHAALGLNCADVSALIKAGLRTALGFKTGLFARGVVIRGVTCGAGHTFSAVRMGYGAGGFCGGAGAGIGVPGCRSGRIGLAGGGSCRVPGRCRGIRVGARRSGGMRASCGVSVRSCSPRCS